MSGPRFSVTPAGALEDVIAGLMKDSDYRVLSALGTFTARNGWTTPVRQIRFAERCGFGRQKVNEALTVLEWLGWVQIKRAERSDRPSAYRVVLDIGEERQPGQKPAQTLAQFKRQRRAILNGARSAEHAARAAGAVGVVDEDGGAEAGEFTPTLSPMSDTPLVAGQRQGGCRSCGDTPCRHCDDSRNDSSERKKIQKSPGHDEPTAEDLDWWREARSRLKAAVGPYEWAAWGARLRLASQRHVIVITERDLMDLQKQQGARLKAAGVQGILAEETGWAVALSEH